MAEKIKVDQELLQENISKAYGIFKEISNELLKDMLAESTENAISGKEFSPSIEIQIGCKNCTKDEESDEQVTKTDVDELKSLLSIVEEITKKEPNKKHLDEMLNRLKDVLVKR